MKVSESTQDKVFFHKSDKYISKFAEHKKLISRVIYILLLIGSVMFVSNVGGGFSYVLFFSVVLYPVVAFIQLLYTRFAVRIYQDVSGRLLYKNTATDYQMTISNSGPFPVGGITIKKDGKISDFEEDFTVNEYNLLPGENITIDTKISCRYAGGYTAGISRIIIRDIFSLLELSYDIPTPLRIQVLPIVTDVAVNDINHFYEKMSHKSNIYRLDSDDIVLGNELRKYKTGDPLNTVHWKNYARTGEMYVRLPDKQESEMLTLVIIPEMVPTIERHDFMLEYIVSVADWFAAQGKPVKIVYYCGGVHNYLIENYDTFRVFYMDKLKDFGTVGKAFPENAADLLRETASEETGAVMMFSEESGSYVN